MIETQNIEYKSIWCDEYLRWICGFANANGGTLYIGKDDNGTIVISEGLKAGEQVVSAGIHALSDGEKVWLLPQVSPTNAGGLL